MVMYEKYYNSNDDIMAIIIMNNDVGLKYIVEHKNFKSILLSDAYVIILFFLMV